MLQFAPDEGKRKGETHALLFGAVKIFFLKKYIPQNFPISTLFSSIAGNSQIKNVDGNTSYSTFSSMTVSILQSWFFFSFCVHINIEDDIYFSLLFFKKIMIFCI